MLNNKVSGILQFDSITGEYISPTLLLCKRNGDVIAKLPYSNLNTSLVGIGLDEISFDCPKEDFENLYTDSTLTKKVWDELEGLKIIDYRCNGEKFKQFEANVTVNDNSTGGYEMSTEFNDVIRNLGRIIDVLKSNNNVIKTLVSQNITLKELLTQALDKIDSLEETINGKNGIKARLEVLEN